MNRLACYRKNLKPSIPAHRACHMRFSSSAGLVVAILTTLAILVAVGCGKSATQYITRGNQLYSSGQYGDAVLNYRNALKKNPSSGEAYYRLGIALLKQYQVAEAY